MKKKIDNPDVANESPEYWEKVLASYGLGINQPLTDNSDPDDATAEAPYIPRNSSLNEKQNDLVYLRGVVDASDRFMQAHEIKKIRGRVRKPPEWALNNARVREVVLRSFPTLRTSEVQRNKAARWVRVIYLYYRMGLPRQVVAKEIGVTKNALKMMVRNMGLAARGLRADGSGKRKGA